MIETKNLTKNYGNLTAVDDLTLTIKDGDIFGFIGPNGAGKTTTMRVLVTLLEPTHGSAFINGLNVTKDGKKVRRLVGYMPDIVEGVLELTDLESKKSATVDSLSRGMQQRLGLARVLIHDPKVLILDEPASGLDPRARIEIRELLRELKRMGKTIMISSHILSELEEICDHVGIIEHGRLVFSGTLEEIRSRLGIESKVRVKVADHQSKAVELLSALPQVRQVQALGGEIAITFHEGKDADGIVARTLVNAGLDIISIQPERLKLDDAFLQLTKGMVH